MTIEWTEDLATGVEKIDAQHRELYRKVAELHELMRHNRTDQAPAILEFLQRYALEHFATEEREMARTAYPGLGAHKLLHKAFVEAFLRHKALLSARVTNSAVLELSTWLGGWLRDHVRGVDREMARHLKAHPPPR